VADLHEIVRFLRRERELSDVKLERANQECLKHQQSAEHLAAKIAQLQAQLQEALQKCNPASFSVFRSAADVLSHW
jgi:hypothetical protein